MLKKALIIFAHPNAHSYCGSLRDTTVKKLSSMGFEVLESDLYKINFNPVITPKDYKVDQDKEDVNISEALKKTYQQKALEPEVQAELDKVFAADYLCFIAPMWWGGFPAILKGWLDRVLLRGAVFDVPDGVFKGGYLKGRKVLLTVTTGWPEEFFSKEGKMASGQTIEDTYRNIINGGFAFCGMETLPIFPVYALDLQDQQQLKKKLEDYEKMLSDIENIKPIYSPILHD